jgi:hypothetical protein
MKIKNILVIIKLFFIRLGQDIKELSRGKIEIANNEEEFA